MAVTPSFIAGATTMLTRYYFCAAEKNRTLHTKTACAVS